METALPLNAPQRVPAFLAYIPVIGWIYLFLFQRKNHFAFFHMRQSVGLVLFMILITAAWGLAIWLLSWIPYAFVLGIALFTLVLTAYIFGVIALVTGMVNALRYREVPLPLFGSFANRLPL